MRRMMTVVALGMFVSACGGSTPTAPAAPTPAPTPAPSRAVVKVTVSPNPILATPSGNAAFPNKMDYTVTVSETAGVGLNINRLIRSYQEYSGGPEWEKGISNPADLIAKAGTNHVNAKGSLNAGAYTITYNGSRQFTLTVSVEAIDDLGNTVTATTGDVSILTSRGVKGAE